MRILSGNLVVHGLELPSFGGTGVEVPEKYIEMPENKLKG